MMIRQKIVDAIKSSNTIAIIPHVMADGDAWGSSLALAIGLRTLNKTIDFIVEERIPDYYRFLQEIELAKLELPKGEHDLTITIDSGDIDRLGRRKEIFEKSRLTINIDHHETNTEFADINYVKNEVSSVGEMLYDILVELGIDIDKSIALSLYVAISTDTGGFRFSNTAPETHEIIARLIKTGIDVSEISRKLFDVKPLKKIKLISSMLGTLKLYGKDRIALAYITNEMFESTNTTPDDTDQLINICLDIEGVDVAVLIKYHDEKYQKVNLRSCSDYDVSKLAVEHGGGGHKKAAGFSSSLSTNELIRILSRDIIKGLKKI